MTQIHARRHPAILMLLAVLGAASARAGMPDDAAADAAGNVASDALRPNILWITSEDNGPHLGCYGDPDAHTPNLDALAARGMHYWRAWSNAPVCAPARTTIITGVHAPTLGAQHMRSLVDLPEGMHLFPRYLRGAGYYCSNRAKEDYNVRAPEPAWDDSSPRAHWRGRHDGQPFFAVFNINVTHESQIRKRPYAPKHDPGRVRLPAYHPDHPEVRADWAQYHDRMTEMDARAGAILQELHEDGLADSTIVVYFGDHGPGMPRCKRWPYDSGLRVPLIVHVPERFASLAPPDYAPGARSSRLVSFVDLAPTMLRLAGLEPPAYMQGSAFAGTHAGPAPRVMYGYRGRMDERVDLVRSVTDGRFVYIRNSMPHRIQGAHVEYMFRTPTTRAWQDLHARGALAHAGQSRFWEPKPAEELYDLEHDPDEVRNLLDDEDALGTEAEARLAHLRIALQEHLVSSRDLGFLPEHELHERTGDATMGAAGSAPAELGAALDAADIDRAWRRIAAAARAGDIAAASAAIDPGSRSAVVDRAEATLIAAARPAGAPDVEAEAEARATLIAAADLERASLELVLRALNAIDAADAARPWPRADIERLRALPRTRPDIPGRMDGFVARLIDHILARHPAPPPPAEHVYKSVDGHDLTLFVHQPAGAASGAPTASGGRPAVVLFHGGGWTGGQPSQFFDQCAHLAERGVVGISAAYRLRSTHGTPPAACVADAKSAVRWVRAHAAELGIDPGRIAAGGGSAGGHIAAATATLDGYDDEPDDAVSCRPDALVLFNPVLDNGPGGWGHDRVGAEWASISPLHNVRPGIPPSLVMLGTEDALVPVATAQRWAERVAEAGGTCTIRLHDGAGHGFFNRSRSAKHYEATVAEMDAFLAELGWIELGSVELEEIEPAAR